MKRRLFLQASCGAVMAAGARSSRADAPAAPTKTVSASQRMRGLLFGGLIGDALGGPLEFSERPSSELGLVDARHWDDRRQLSPESLQELADTLPLLGYESLRPDVAPYGPWRANAPAGTLTDDSRHKIVLARAISAANQQGRPISARAVAQQFLEFTPRAEDDHEVALSALNDEGFREYRYASRWLLGERDLSRARPLHRLWAGVNNCSGQMLLPPLAVRYAGRPEAAYRAAYRIDFIDTPLARDMAAAVVAGLAAALDPRLEDAPPSGRWEALWNAMHDTDPFGYADVPFAGRQLHKWMHRSEDFAARSDKRPKELYRLLETEGQPEYWWDAHFTLLVPLSILHLCDFAPLAAMHLTLDFGHDTDSYAQILGCMIGAVHGLEIFPQEMVDAVQASLDRDYGEDVEQWWKILQPTSKSAPGTSSP